jgi:hypothetical protein
MMMKKIESRKGLVRQASCREFQAGWTTMGETGVALLGGIIGAVGSRVNLLKAKIEHKQTGHHPPPPSRENRPKDEQRSMWWLWQEKGLEKEGPIKDQSVQDQGLINQPIAPNSDRTSHADVIIISPDAQVLSATAQEYLLHT